MHLSSLFIRHSKQQKQQQIIEYLPHSMPTIKSIEFFFFILKSGGSEGGRRKEEKK